MARKVRLLIVEDEAAIRSGLVDVFVYHGYEDILNSVQYMADERQIAIMRENLIKLSSEGGA